MLLFLPVSDEYRIFEQHFVYNVKIHFGDP